MKTEAYCVTCDAVVGPEWVRGGCFAGHQVVVRARSPLHGSDALLNRALPMLERLGDFIGNGEGPTKEERCNLILAIKRHLGIVDTEQCEKQSIVVTGSFAEGFQFVGPFENDDAAEKWADGNIGAAGGEAWIGLLLRPTEPGHVEGRYNLTHRVVEPVCLSCRNAKCDGCECDE